MGEHGLKQPDPGVFLRIHQKLNRIDDVGTIQSHEFTPPVYENDLRSEITREMLRIGEILYSLMCRMDDSHEDLMTGNPLDYMPSATLTTSKPDCLNYVSNRDLDVEPPNPRKMLIEPQTGIITESDVHAGNEQIIVANDRMLTAGEKSENGVNQEIICADEDPKTTYGLNSLYDL